MSTNNPMTEEQLDAIQERVDAATPGPWAADSDDPAYIIYPEQGGWDGLVIAQVADQDGALFPVEHNGALIAHAPQDLTDLLAEVARLRHFESIVSWRYGDTTDGKTRDAMVEKAARTLYLREISWSSEAKWDRLPDPVKRMWRLKAEAVLDAAHGTGEGA